MKKRRSEFKGALPENKSLLHPNEEDWMLSLATKAPGVISSYSSQLDLWEIRMDPLSFSNWRKALHQHTLFFDGASKGNSGATRGCGVLLIPDKTTAFTLS